MTNLSAQKLYQSVDNESQILHSSPQQIIHILLKTVISRIKQAKLFIQKQEIVKRVNRSIKPSIYCKRLFMLISILLPYNAKMRHIRRYTIQ